MATRYGLNSKRVSTFDINSTTLTNMTMITEGNDTVGGYYISAYVNANAGGCGTQIDPCLAITIKNEAMVGWKRISYKTYTTATAACWSMASNIYGASTNLQSFSTGSGDYFFKSINCFELSQYAKKDFACDNNSDNFMHPAYLTGTFREWHQVRRRNSLTTVAGPSFGMSCNSVGSTAIVTISDIYIYI
jgi:hypothetical protein